MVPPFDLWHALCMRVFPRQRVDPVLVTRESAAELLSVDLPTVDRLIECGDLPITKTVGKTVLIPYRSLLIYAGVARWRFQEVVDA
jgi:excisionase family DNA binding protein